MNPKRFLQVVTGIKVAERHIRMAVLRVSYALDALPTRVLERLGLLGPLKEAYTDGRVSESMVRLVFGVTAVGFVFVLSLGLAAMTLLVREIVLRRRRPVEP